MMKSPMMRVVGSIVWLVTALGCIHLGLGALGYDPISMLGLTKMSHLLMLIFGAAGVVSLIMFFMGGCCGDEHHHTHTGSHR